MSLLQVKNVSHSYVTHSMFKRKKHVKPVLSNVSFMLEEGNCLGLLGASGAGKSTLGKIILGLEKPTQGEILFQGHNLYNLEKSMRHQLRRDLQVVFQDSFSSVNPRMNVEKIIAEPLESYEKLMIQEQHHKIIQLLERVGLSEKDLTKFPHEFSGGQLQRINIARAIALKPKLIVLDESVSSLDMINQNVILNLLNDLKADFGISYLFITHDIKAAHTVSDKLGILDNGCLVETFDAPDQFFTSSHPAVHQLRSAMLSEHPSKRRIRGID